MEIHRLKPMTSGYDEGLFNKLYQKTEGLRKKLASEINPHKFNLTYQDILSWFDDKFIWVFNKYNKAHNEEVLLGHLINSLKFFKCRILRAAYTIKFSQKIIQMEDFSSMENSVTEDYTEKDNYRKLEDLFNYLYTIISYDAIYVLRLTLNPPPYILRRINFGNKLNYKISNELICDYLQMPTDKEALQYLTGLKKEIDYGINQAKNYFRNY